MQDKDALWINFRWAIDVEYTRLENVPILAALISKYVRFWDGTFWYQWQSNFILRWPDWRARYRVDLESWKRHHGIKDRTQSKLTDSLP